MNPLRSLLPDLHTDEVAIRHHERAVVISLGGLGGAELRPSRLFLWAGLREAGYERVLPLGRPPRLLKRPHRRRYFTVGRRWQVSYLGNPAVTVGLFGWRMGRQLLAPGRDGHSAGGGTPSVRGRDLEHGPDA